MAAIDDLVQKGQFPRSNDYEIDWVLDNQMGPNALWLMEWITGALDLKAGMRVLDLGCGRGMSSIFLAKEFGLRVWGTDLWIGPDGNYRRAQEAGVNPLLVQQMLGHATLEMTGNYTHLGIEAQREALANIVPVTLTPGRTAVGKRAKTK